MLTELSEFDAYQEFTKSMSRYPDSQAIQYTALGLAGESGEYCDKIKKIIRGDPNHASNQDLAYELGDVLFYVSEAARQLGYKLSEIADMNIVKLLSRKERNVIKGSGDNR